MSTFASPPAVTSYLTRQGRKRYRVRWAIRTVDSGGEPTRAWRGKAGFTKWGDAVEFRDAVTADPQRYGVVGGTARRRLTVAQWAQEWLDGLTLAPSTMDNYRVQVEVHLVPRIGAMRLDEVTSQRLRALYGDLLKRGRAHGRCRTAGPACEDHEPDDHRGLSTKSVRNTAAVASRLFGTAERDGLISVDPSKGDEMVPRSTRGGRRVDAREKMFTPDEVVAVLQAAMAHPFGIVWELALETGARREELCGLRFRDVDLQGRRLHLAMQTATSVRGGRVDRDGGKSEDASRVITLDAELVQRLRAHRAAEVAKRERMGLPWLEYEDAFVITDERARPVKPTRLTRMTRRMLVDLGIEPVDLPAGAKGRGLHAMRHTHGSMLLSAGVPLNVVSARLGHSSPAITASIYSHALPDEDQVASDAMARLLRPHRDAQ